MANAPVKNQPLIAAAALAGTGVLLRQWKPTMLDLPEASLFKVQYNKLLSLTSFIPVRDMPDRLTRTSGNTLLVVVPTRIIPPPNGSSPPFTGRFLI